MLFGASTLWIEHKYISLLSYKLEQFKRASPTLYRFRCPLCGDSGHNKLKARGYVFENDGSLLFKCHNCGVATGFGRLLETVDPDLYRDFRLECIREAGVKQEKPTWKPDIGAFPKRRVDRCNILKSLKKISQLEHNHPAMIYVRDTRKIPSRNHYKLYHCPKFVKFVNELIPGKLEEKFEEPRLIIPFLDQKGYLFGFQGRSYKKKTDLRYITIMLDESKPKVFGLDSVDFSKETFILEGPLDSLFVRNSLAFGGSDGNILEYTTKDKATLVYDNEPRNLEICKKIFQSIQEGFRVFIWPEHIKTKDINDLVISGMELSEIPELLSTNTFSGMSAHIRFNAWKRVQL